jgi:predicted ATPase
MKRYILTGTPGTGKTVLLRQLELQGFSVVEEAATDIIALKHAAGVDEPWRDESFIDEIANLQRIRATRSSQLPGEVQFHDRSIFCTAALSDYLGRPRSPALVRELDRILGIRWFQPEVFFVRSLGFIAPTAARRISMEDAVRFERVHEEVYREFGFEMIPVEPASPAARADQIRAFLSTKKGQTA